MVTLIFPLRVKRSILLCVRTFANTGSTTAIRWGYISRPFLLSIFSIMDGVRLSGALPIGTFKCKIWYSIRQTMSEKFRTQIHPKFVPLRWLDCQMSDLWRFKIDAVTEQSSQHKGDYESTEIGLSKCAQWTQAPTWSYSVRKIVSRFSQVTIAKRLVHGGSQFHFFPTISYDLITYSYWIDLMRPESILLISSASL